MHASCAGFSMLPPPDPVLYRLFLRSCCCWPLGRHHHHHHSYQLVEHTMLPRRRKQQLQPATAPKMDVLSPTQLNVRVGLMPTKSGRRPINVTAPPAEPAPLSSSQPNVRVGFLPSYSYASDAPAQPPAPAMVPLPLSNSLAPPTTHSPLKKKKQQQGPTGQPS